MEISNEDLAAIQRVAANAAKQSPRFVDGFIRADQASTRLPTTLVHLMSQKPGEQGRTALD